MGRKPCCSKEGLNKGAWTAIEDMLLTEYIKEHGEGTGWRSLPKKAGLIRCGKSCRLRWVNYLKPGLKRGSFTSEEDDLIVRLYNLLGSRWSLIAGRIHGRTDNDIKNYWNTHLLKKLKAEGNEPRRHKSLAKQTRRRTKEKTNASSQNNQKNNKKTKEKKQNGNIENGSNIEEREQVAKKTEEQWHMQDDVQAVSANNHNFTSSSSSEDVTSNAASTSEVYLEENDNIGIYDKFQMIDELLLDDNCLLPINKCTEFNTESHMMLKEIYEEYFQLVSESHVILVKDHVDSFVCFTQDVL